MRSGLRSLATLIVLTGTTFAIAAFAAQFRPGPWYGSLDKPTWTPPDAVFAPVWMALYALMSLAVWQVWRKRGWNTHAMLLYAAQLVFNGVWSWLFFGLHRIGLAAVEIALLSLLIVTTLIAFWRISAVAGTLLLPYAAWVVFAAALNAAVWRLNS